MRLRSATPDDAGWINERYAAIGFIPSDLHREIVVVAELDGEHAGIGRLVPAGGDAYELGGMYVFDAFRGRGVARAIVDELIRRAADATLYCIPFEDLTALYAAAGFVPASEEGVPEHVKEKLAWCRREIDRPVVLLKLRRA